MRTTMKQLVICSIFIIAGIASAIFTVTVIVPKAEYNAKVCTLEVDAVVIGNESRIEEDVDWGTNTHYDQIVAYTVGDEYIELQLRGTEPEPVEEGTIIKLWVDPTYPRRYINDKDIGIILPVMLVMSSLFALFGMFGCICVLKGRKKK